MNNRMTLPRPLGLGGSSLNGVAINNNRMIVNDDDSRDGGIKQSDK